MKIKMLLDCKVTENFNAISYNQPIADKLLFCA